MVLSIEREWLNSLGEIEGFVKSNKRISITILPDVPSFVDDRKSQVVFNFQSSFVGSILTVTLAKAPTGEGELIIQTDNYSVLTIMKDQITAQANQRNL